MNKSQVTFDIWPLRNMTVSKYSKCENDRKGAKAYDKCALVCPSDTAGDELRWDHNQTNYGVERTSLDVPQ